MGDPNFRLTPWVTGDPRALAWCAELAVYKARSEVGGRQPACSVFLNRMGSGTVALTFLSLQTALGDGDSAAGAGYAFFLYAGLGGLVSVFYYLCVPDTAGLDLEAVAEKVGRGHSEDEEERAALVGEGPGVQRLD